MVNYRETGKRELETQYVPDIVRDIREASIFPLTPQSTYDRFLGAIDSEGGNEVSLSLREMRILEFLLTHTKSILSKKDIYTYLYPENSRYYRHDDPLVWKSINELVESGISYLRKKLKRTKDSSLLESIRTVSSIGYIWTQPLEKAMVIPIDVQIFPDCLYSFGRRAMKKRDPDTGEIKSEQLEKTSSQMLEALIYDPGRHISLQELKILLFNPKCEPDGIYSGDVGAVKRRLKSRMNVLCSGLGSHIMRNRDGGGGYWWDFPPVAEAESSVSDSSLFSNA